MFLFINSWQHLEFKMTTRLVVWWCYCSPCFLVILQGFADEFCDFGHFDAGYFTASHNLQHRTQKKKKLVIIYVGCYSYRITTVFIFNLWVFRRAALQESVFKIIDLSGCKTKITTARLSGFTCSLSNMMPPLDWMEQISLCLFMAIISNPSITRSSRSQGSTSR